MDMTGAMSYTHWLIVITLVVVLFGRNKISSTFLDIGKSIKHLKDITNG
jgi:TatA/E family protein of Tat protein translocase